MPACMASNKFFLVYRSTDESMTDAIGSFQLIVSIMIFRHVHCTLQVCTPYRYARRKSDMAIPERKPLSRLAS